MPIFGRSSDQPDPGEVTRVSASPDLSGLSGPMVVQPAPVGPEGDCARTQPFTSGHRRSGDGRPAGLTQSEVFESAVILGEDAGLNVSLMVGAAVLVVAVRVAVVVVVVDVSREVVGTATTSAGFVSVVSSNTFGEVPSHLTQKCLRSVDHEVMMEGEFCSRFSYQSSASESGLGSNLTTLTLP